MTLFSLFLNLRLIHSFIQSQVYMFSRWVKARFVRLSIVSYHNAPSLRWDLLFGDVKEELATSFSTM